MRALWIVLGVAGAAFAQPKEPCYAFLLRGDINVVCQGKTTPVTHRGDIHNFAVSDELASLAYITGDVGTATILNLKTGASKRTPAVDEVVRTCGGILPIPAGGSPTTQELVTGEALSFPPYSRFRCSADRKIVAGIVRHELFLGVPPGRKIALAGTVHDLYFNISPNGQQIAYFNDIRPLCVVTGDAPARCVEHETMSDVVSVNDSGEVLAATGTGKGCVYKTAYNFYPATPSTAGDDECLGIGYWKPGLTAIQFLQPVGRNPQWLAPDTAKLLTDRAKVRPL